MVIGAVVGYFIAKKINDANYNIFIEQAKAKAKAIEFEAKNILSNAKLSVQEAEFAAKKKFDDKFQKIQKEYDLKFSELDKKSENLVLQEEKIEEKIAEVDKFRKEAQILYDEGQLCKSNYEAKISEALLVLERSAGLTTEEARAEILRKVEENSRADIAHIVRKYEEMARKEGQKRANYIIAQATTRYAGEYAAERLINVVNIKNDDLKGRIIGKEGRNIKTLEMILGVDVIIDDTPNAIVL